MLRSAVRARFPQFMTRIDTLTQAKFDTEIIRVKTPDGSLFVMILEDSNGRPIGIHLSIGKGGSSVLAWSDAVARVCSLVLDRGGTIGEIIDELSSITTDRTVNSNGVPIRSGVEGLAFALRQYQQSKRDKLQHIVRRRA